ncbi:MAG: hypothetical protein LBQ27_01310, partial [Clostridiales bacterium]|nr:hypothetical protein [Clostridiales bacterium]
MNKKTVKIILVVAAIVAAAIIVFSVPYLFDKRTKYGIELYLDSQNMILSATQTVDYFNATGDVLDEIKFNLYPNAFREGAKIKPYYDNDFENVYPDGADYGGIIVSEAASGKNKLQYSVNGKDMNILTVELDKPLKPRTSKKISLIYTVKIPKTNLRFGYSDGLINLTNFFPSVCVYKDGNFIECPYYPTGDPFFSEASDFDVKLVTDKSYAAAHSGNLKSE